MKNIKKIIEKLIKFGFSKEEAYSLINGISIRKDDPTHNWGEIGHTLRKYMLRYGIYEDDSDELALFESHTGTTKGCFWTDWSKVMNLETYTEVLLPKRS